MRRVALNAVVFTTLVAASGCHEDVNRSLEEAEVSFLDEEPAHPARGTDDAGPDLPSHSGHRDWKAYLGELIFFDAQLSLESNQACAACHAPDVGWTGAELLSNLSGGIYEGSVHSRFGNRKAPASAYNVFAPVLDFVDGAFIGGNFWDGRATGWRLGSPAADQAQGPFLNPLEQALPSGAAVVKRVCKSSYGHLFRSVWGRHACQDMERGFAAVAYSIEAFEKSKKASPFTSKYDAYLAGRGTLTALEERGLQLFENEARCAACHSLHTEPGAKGPYLTDFSYDNLGVPRNQSNPFYRMSDVYIDGQPINPLGFAWVDPGQGGFIERLAEDSRWRSEPNVPESVLSLSPADLAEIAIATRGKHKVPTLRNVAKRPFASFTKGYTHNGYFKTLAGLVHFYNTRDAKPPCPGDFPESVALSLGCWPRPEVPENVNAVELGNLGLSEADEAAIVAFLETLTDEGD